MVLQHQKLLYETWSKLGCLQFSNWWSSFHHILLASWYIQKYLLSSWIIVKLAILRCVNNFWKCLGLSTLRNIFQKNCSCGTPRVLFPDLCAQLGPYARKTPSFACINTLGKNHAVGGPSSEEIRPPFLYILLLKSASLKGKVWEVNVYRETLQRVKISKLERKIFNLKIPK